MNSSAKPVAAGLGNWKCPHAKVQKEERRKRGRRNGADMKNGSKPGKEPSQELGKKKILSKISGN